MTTSSSHSRFARLRSLFGATADDGRLGTSVSATRAVDLVRDGAAMLDVRERHEWTTGHAPQAVHVPLGEIDKAPRRLPAGRPVVVVCASGMRSRTAARQLRSLGLDAASISGGMAAWQRAGGAVRQ
ncbi:rhodanese-like domain-containing protein [Georgenia yuyongxinii]